MCCVVMMCFVVSMVLIIFLACSGSDDLWIMDCIWEYAGKIFQRIPAYEIAKALGPSLCIWLKMFYSFTGCDTVLFLVVDLEVKTKKLHGRLGKHNTDVSLQHSVKTNTDNQTTIHTWLERVERFIVLLYMIAPVARCLSMKLECNYLLREDKQLMKCHQQKLHLQHIRESCLPSWSLLGSSNNCFSRVAMTKWLNKNTDGGGMGSPLDNSTRGYTSLQRNNTMWLQERLKRMLKATLECTAL